MKIMHLTPSDYPVSQWAGGSTTQIAIMPPEAHYAARQFLWRVSTAVAVTEESDYTALPDYDRLLTTLSGSIWLQHDHHAPILLHPGQIHAFSGAAHTHTWGRCTDFNLMTRRGHCDGRLEYLHTAQNAALALSAAPSDDAVLYCYSGSGKLYGHPLQSGEALLLSQPEPTLELFAAADSTFLLACVVLHRR